MTGAVLEWLGILARWIHVIAGIMWIGDSLLFMWIDSHLSPDPQSRTDVTGVSWLIHGGGYYHLEKRKLVPGHLPPYLRWFWLEATTTWISGFLLLVLVYYASADAFMVDRSVSNLTAGQAVAAGPIMLLGGWFLYDTLWRIPLVRYPVVALSASFALLVGVIYAATHLLSARAAFLHVGAMLGTIMAANVWVHILPPQRKMLQAAQEGQEIDYSLGTHAKTRSTHNTYLTFPAILLMISQHFPLILGAPLNWLVLTLLIAVGAGARQVMLVGIRAAGWTGVATAAAAVAIGLLTVPPASTPVQPSSASGPASAVPSFTEVRTIVVQRCAVCHSETPSMAGVTSAPNGMKLDTPQQIRARAAAIKLRAVDLKSMPPGNVTHLTVEERAILERWVEAGAPIK